MSEKLESLNINPFNPGEEKEQLDRELNIAAKAVEEQLSAAREILAAQKEEAIKKQLTNPSAIALEQTRRDSGENMSSVRKTARQLFNLYLTNQFVARGVNVRADTLVYKGHEIRGPDTRGVDLCKELVYNSGGTGFFAQLAKNTYISGDGFLEPIFNRKGNKILKLKHVHPLTLGFKKNQRTGKIILDSNKEPKSYVQFYVDADGVEQEKEISKDKIRHFKFNALGDEFNGLSIIQPGYNTIVRLMNMEYSAAEAAVKAANPLIVGTANTKSPHQIAQWGQILGRISGREQVFIPEGMTIEFMSPGKQNFNDYADYFLSAVVSSLGVPKAVLLGDNEGGGNRAEQVILTRHFYSLIRSDQRTLEEFMNNIFEEYADIAGFVAPKLFFEDIAEDSASLASEAIELYQAGIVTLNEARQMIGLDNAPTEGKKPGGNLTNDLKKSDMEAWHPATPGSPAGSQKGVKKAQKTNPSSEVNPLTTK